MKNGMYRLVVVVDVEARLRAACHAGTVPVPDRQVLQHGSVISGIAQIGAGQAPLMRRSLSAVSCPYRARICSGAAQTAVHR